VNIPTQAKSGLEWATRPGVFGDDVGGEEVDFAGEVGDGASSAAVEGIDAVEAVEELGGAFDLDAPEGRVVAGIGSAGI